MFKIISFKHKQPKPPIPHCLHITDEVDILKRKLVIGVGVGSGRGFYEGLARCGVSNFLFMYHEDEHSRYSNMLDLVADRNFVQVRMSPFVGEHLGLHVLIKPSLQITASLMIRSGFHRCRTMKLMVLRLVHSVVEPATFWHLKDQ